MADDIKIRVGVSNNVRAGMDGVVRDVEQGAARAATGLDRKMRGVGFRETLLKFFRGDLSGAVDDLAQRFQTKMGGAALKLTGILTAAFAGVEAGKMLDQKFGLSDKLGAVFSRQFGTQEDTGLKAFEKAKDAYNAAMKGLGEEETGGESSQAKKARENIEKIKAAMQQVRDATGDMAGNELNLVNAWMDKLQERLDRAEKLQADVSQYEGKIKGLEADNEAVAARGTERQRQALQDAEERQRLEATAKASSFTPGVMGRLMGQGERDMQGQADYQTRMALDDDFRRGERQQQRQVDRAERRRQRFVAQARDAANRFTAQEGSVITPEDEKRLRQRMGERLWRVREAEMAQEAANANKQNLEQLQADAAKAAIQAQKDAAETAKNTAAIKDLKDLLTMKGGN